MQVKGMGFLKQPSSLIWGLALLFTLTGIVMAAFVQFGTYCNWISPNLVKELLGQYLTVLGMLTAVTIAIMSWIYNQSVSSRQKGFGDLRDGLSGLTQDALEMYLNFTRASPSHQPFLRSWATGTNDVIQRLDKITPGWKGWEESEDLEKKLSTYTNLGMTILLNTGNFLATDLVWTKIFANRAKHDRNVLIGLYWLSTGAMAYVASLRLFQFFISIVVLFLLCLTADIIAMVGTREYLNYNILAIFLLTLLLICHIIWLVLIIGLWWQKQRSQEKYWESR